MEKIKSTDSVEPSLRPITLIEEDIKEYIRLEQSVSDTDTYIVTLDQEEAVSEILENNSFFIKINNENIGHISYRIEENGRAYINSLVISPEYQGHKLGKQAMQIILEKISSLGVNSTYLVVHPDNTTAINLYSSLGFTLGEKHENYFGNGEPRQEMVLDMKNIR